VLNKLVKFGNKSLFGVQVAKSIQCRYAPLRSPEFKRFSGDFFADFPPEFRDNFFLEMPRCKIEFFFTLWGKIGNSAKIEF
jgi:hypothetical protein